MINLRRGGDWGDITSSKIGLMVIAYPQGNNIKVETVNRLGETVDVKTIFFDEPILFVRIATSNGSVVICGQGNPSGKFYIKGVNIGIIDPKLTTYGTHVCDVIYDGDKYRYVCQISETEYFDSLDNARHPIPSAIHGTSQGIIQLLSSGPQWADLVRQSVSGMLYPFEMPNLFIGEGQEDPAHIECLDGIEHKNIFQGFAARPRAANIDNNLLGIATRDDGGTFFLLMERPYPNFAEEVPPVIEPPPVVEPPPIEPEPEPMACTPVVPPQDVVSRSTEAIRNFCQTYEFGGGKPYAADEIHENGLFLADGLLYFMMSDTGLWAKLLMNPDDKRDWEAKRKSADAALFDYMRRRVGDVPAQHTPGGQLSGDVNV